MAGRIPDMSELIFCPECNSRDIGLLSSTESRESEDETEVQGFREYHCKMCSHNFKGGFASKKIKINSSAKPEVE